MVVTSDLEDTYSFPITGSSWDMLWGQSVLISGSSLRPWTLTPTSSSERMAVRHRDIILAHLKELGLRLNVRKVCFSSTENHLSGRGVGSDHDAGTYVPRIESFLTSVKRVSEGRSLTVRQFQKLLGLMSAASNVIPFGLLYMRPLQSERVRGLCSSELRYEHASVWSVVGLLSFRESSCWGLRSKSSAVSVSVVRPPLTQRVLEASAR